MCRGHETELWSPPLSAGWGHCVVFPLREKCCEATGKGTVPGGLRPPLGSFSNSKPGHAGCQGSPRLSWTRGRR